MTQIEVKFTNNNFQIKEVNNDPGDGSQDNDVNVVILDIIDENTPPPVQVLMDSLRAMAKPESTALLVVDWKILIAETQEDQAQEEEMLVNNQSKTQISMMELKRLKLEDANERLKKAKKLNGGSKAYRITKAAFSAIVALATVAAGVFLTLMVPGAQGVGIVMIGSGLAQCLLAADSLTQAITGEGLFYLYFTEVRGKSEEEARWRALALTLYLTAFVIACSIASLCAASTVAGMTTMMQLMMTATTMFSLLQAGTFATMDTIYAVNSYKAAEIRLREALLRADIVEIGADLDKLQGDMELVMQYIKDIYDMILKSLFEFLDMEKEKTERVLLKQLTG